MRILVAAAAALVMLGSANAQSLEESYAKLCPQPAVANVEACLALQQALSAKQDQEQPQSRTSKSSEADPIWGPLAQLANTAWGVGAPGTFAVVDRFTWIEDGTAVRFTSEVPGMPASLTEIVFRPSPEPGILSAVITYQREQTNVLFRFNEGALVSDWYLTVSGNISNRQEIRLTGDGQYESRKALDMRRMTSKTIDLNVDRPDFAPLHGQYKRYSEGGIAQLEAQSRGKGAEVDRQFAEQVAAEQRAAKAEKAARSSERAAMFGAVLQGLAQGAAEVNTGGYAESQANLDATVANIQYAADVERQQQVLAQQQAQARAAEQQRQQLAENARWVAEKEQAASEYRSGQVEAAAAREAQLVAQQQADQQRRAASEAQRRGAEQAAAVERQRLQAAALAERPNISARPVAAAPTPSQSSGHQTSAGSSLSPKSSGPIEMFAFFINLDGKTVAFEGPTAMTVAEGNAKKARLAAEAPGRYGAGATVKVQSMGNGYCAFVYQLPGKGFYVLGSDTNLSTTIEEKDGLVNNGKAVIHHDEVCPTNN